jgi:RNA polymerase sigma-70 factor (ECF subfamily)
MESKWPDENDEEIARRIQAGEEDLFSRLIDRYEAKISRYARKFLSDSDDINDVLQEIFIKVYININSFDVSRKFSPWIYRIAHNELVNALRKKKRNVLPILNLDVFLPYNLSKTAVEKENDDRDIKRMAETCLDGIDLKYREPIILFYFDELSYKEISEILQIPVSTVGIRIKRGREKMKQIYIKNEKITQ